MAINDTDCGMATAISPLYFNPLPCPLPGEPDKTFGDAAACNDEHWNL